jgi:NAD(P)-dependent dehydrogenase (short-subunit alcohol dehydrogenase family)
MGNPARAPQLAEIAERERLPIQIHTLDVDSSDSVRVCFACIREPIDALVNNAGVECHGAIEGLRNCQWKRFWLR